MGHTLNAFESDQRLTRSVLSNFLTRDINHYNYMPLTKIIFSETYSMAVKHGWPLRISPFSSTIFSNSVNKRLKLATSYGRKRRSLLTVTWQAVPHPAYLHGDPILLGVVCLKTKSGLGANLQC
jgi:hypothetical protein